MRHPIDRGAFAGLLSLFGATAESSYLDVQPDVLVARFGLSHQRIARTDVVAARRGTWPWIGGIGWRVAPGVFGLIGSLRGIVEIDLARPYVHHVAVFPMRFRRLVVSLQDPAAFLAELGVPHGSREAS